MMVDQTPDGLGAGPPRPMLTARRDSPTKIASKNEQ
jgi:hypothetical protein